MWIYIYSRYCLMVLDHLFVGAMAGIVSRTCTAPLELYKIQQQNRFIPYSTPREVIMKEGVYGLWKGNFTNCIRIGPQTAINFTIFHWSKRDLWEKVLDNKHLIHMASGGFSGMISTMCVYPLETVRTRLALQTNKDHYANMIDVFRKMRLLDMYGGMQASLMGFIPYNALSFVFYHYYKECFDHHGVHKNTIPLIAGGMAGMSAVSITYPTDLIRRRLQLKGFDESVPEYNGVLDCVRKIYRGEGIRGLYRGLGVCYVKIFPSVGIQFFVMEYLKALFDIH